MTTIHRLNDGYVDASKHGCSIVEIQDFNAPGLIRDKRIGIPEIDTAFRDLKWGYSFMFPRSSTLPEELNTLLYACKALFKKHEGIRTFCVIRNSKHCSYATKIMEKMFSLHITATSEKGAEQYSSAAKSVIATTGVPIYNFSNAYISICNNLTPLKYMESDYRQRVNMFLSSVTAVEPKMHRRAEQIMTKKLSGVFW